MRNEEPIDLARRRVMQAVLALPAVTFIGCGGGVEAVSPTAPAQPATIPATPACDDGDDDPTPAETEGPYFKPNSPERRNLVESGLAGTPLTITGQVLTTACVPIAAALLDFWQADNAVCAGTSSPTPRGGSRSRRSCRDFTPAARGTST
jgi:hypothetical protein